MVVVWWAVGGSPGGSEHRVARGETAVGCVSQVRVGWVQLEVETGVGMVVPTAGGGGSVTVAAQRAAAAAPWAAP